MNSKKENEAKFQNFFLSGKAKSYKRGEEILIPTNNTDCIYFIETGYVKVYWLTEDGYEKMHVIYKPGEILPLMWALNNEPVEGHYVAMSKVECRQINKEHFINLIRSHPDIIFSLTKKMSDIFKIYVNKVDNLVISRSYPRLISRLIFLAQRFGHEENGEIIIDAPITDTDIAHSIALTRETVNRELQHLEKKGLIGKKDRKIIIFDIKGLEKELSVSYERKALVT